MLIPCWRDLLSDGKTSESDTGTSSRGLVHLTEDKGDLGLALKVDDTSLLHFVVQIVTLTSTLADTAEHGVTTVSLSDVVLDGMLAPVSCAIAGKSPEYSQSAPE
jgi:hypothetical protein